ncbi:hypothetical protein ACFL31_01970 [Candidatus Margulisiibacteriota bacterium]
MSEEQWVKLITADNPQEADIIKGKLDLEKIPVITKKPATGLIGNVYPGAAVGANLGIIDIYVLADSEEKAKEILSL